MLSPTYALRVIMAVLVMYTLYLVFWAEEGMLQGNVVRLDTILSTPTGIDAADTSVESASSLRG